MVTVPPSALPPGSATPPPPPPTPPVGTVAVPAQVVSAQALAEALRQNVLLPVTTMTNTPTAQLVLKTPQGDVTVNLPQILQNQNLTPAQLTLLTSLKNVQVQMLPMPGGGVQAQLIVPTQEWQQVLRQLPQLSTPESNLIFNPSLPQQSAPQVTPQQPVRLSALLLPPDIATAYGVPPRMSATPTTQTSTSIQTQTPANTLPAALQTLFPNLSNKLSGLLQFAAPAMAKLEHLLPGLMSSPSAPQQANTPISPAATPGSLVDLPHLTMPAGQTSQSTIELPTLQVMLPSPQTPRSAIPPQAVPLDVTFIGRTPKGEMLVQLDDTGEVLLVPHTPSADAKQGSRITLYALPPEIASAAVTLPSGDDLGPQYTALKETLQLLSAQMPALGRHLEQQLVVKGGQSFSPAILFLLSAMGSRTALSSPPRIDNALREALMRLGENTGNSALLPRFEAEMQRLVSNTTDQQGHEWRSFALPTATSQTNDGFQMPMTFLVQHRQQQRPDDAGGDSQSRNAPDTEKQTRFVVDMHFSRLGHTQLEGLSRSRQLDLLLRTSAPLTQSLQQELTARYDELLQATGLTGALMFNRGMMLAFRPTQSLGNASV